MAQQSETSRHMEIALTEAVESLRAWAKSPERDESILRQALTLFSLKIAALMLIGPRLDVVNPQHKTKWYDHEWVFGVAGFLGAALALIAAPPVFHYFILWCRRWTP